MGLAGGQIFSRLAVDQGLQALLGRLRCLAFGIHCGQPGTQIALHRRV